MMNKETATQALEWLTMSRNPFNRLTAMVGASRFSLGLDSVYFRFKMCRKANCCKLGYNAGKDLFTMAFYKIDKYGNYQVAKDFEEVFCEDMKEIFENYTGLYLSL